MSLDYARAEEIARRYTRSSRPLTNLGWGVSGFVFLAPDNTAVKVHKHREPYHTELLAYQRLRRLRIRRLLGLAIPRLRGYRARGRIIRMDTVSPPYLLDFAGVRFEPPDFNDDVIEDWHSRIEEVFGPNAPFVHEVYHALARHDIYYLDFRPSNLNLEGLRGRLPDI